MTLLGKFLEFSVQTEDILESLAFYKSLGFSELAIGDVWQHKYAVVSDGEINIGLHEREFDSPSITFVHPDLAKYSRTMTSRGVEFSVLKIDEDVFNELGFRDRDGHMIRLLEARTFSPPDDDLPRSLCGELLETVLPVRNVLRTGRFWAPLTPVLLRIREEPTTHMRFDAAGMPLGLSESVALEQPSLCFKCQDREGIAAAIEKHALPHRDFPDFEGAFTRLVAPEGTVLYLFDQDFLGEPYIVEESGEFEAL